MNTPRKITDPEGDKRRALHLAAHAQRRLEAAERERDAALKFARDAGGSLREIAEETRIPHMTVSRIIGRTST